jgi:hypothetical protein
VIVFSLVGVGASVAVSWGIAMACSVRTGEVTYTPPPPGSRLSSASRVPSDYEKGTHVVYRGPGIRYEMVTESMWMGSTLGAVSGRKNRSVERVEVGWPWGAMEWAGTMDERVVRREWSAIAGVRVRGWDGRVALGADRRLPLVPLWPGMALDALVFGAGAWAGWSGVRGVRGWRRRRGGRCEGCGYRLAGNVSGTCPECGRRLPSRVGERTITAGLAKDRGPGSIA